MPAFTVTRLAFRHFTTIKEADGRQLLQHGLRRKLLPLCFRLPRWLELEVLATTASFFGCVYKHHARPTRISLGLVLKTKAKCTQQSSREQGGLLQDDLCDASSLQRLYRLREACWARLLLGGNRLSPLLFPVPVRTNAPMQTAELSSADRRRS